MVKTNIVRLLPGRIDIDRYVTVFQTTMVQNPGFSVLGSYAILQLDCHNVLRKQAFPTIATPFFVADLFQLSSNKLTVPLQISTLPKMSANLSILSIVKTVLEHRDSDNQHAIINDE